ncbi:MAG: Sulfite reductase [NADPH] flavoprotein alpha-component [Porticoccaceae bacterium UBA1117]|nr:MAG: Sulfite reductase [NADPH] flavoprotein alpha-component [Porticoccaceae bacterium UBA1117]|tara:strand:+ start:454 stop:2196 length:1743 start_codon:yes stop_codon:yes gene_type:complete
MKLPFIPEDAPFTGDQKSWLSGFLAGMQSAKAIAGSQTSVAGALAAPVLNILYGTQTGNAEGLAMDAATVARAQGFDAVVQGLDDVSIDAFSVMKRVIITIATYGEGEMPDNAGLFWESIYSTDMPRLPDMQFGILALGDTSYDEFCQAGKLLDTRLEQLGATRLVDRLDCDVDYEDIADEWINKTIPLANSGNVIVPAVETSPQVVKSIWNRKNPYPAKVSVNKLLSGPSSGKEIRHYEIDLADSGLTYETGDALNVMPVNDGVLVKKLTERLSVDRDIVLEGQEKSIVDLLTYQYEISTPSRNLIAAVEAQAKHEKFSHVLKNGDKEALADFLWGKDTLDLLNLNSEITFTADEFLGLLKPLQHRAYSISSSPSKHIGSVHLTVASVRWREEGRDHLGVCSTFLADRVTANGTAGVFVSPNKAFRIPANDDAPMIMVGPGTGVAPFRAFLEERQMRGAKGKNWLFFGDQTRDSDFIYEQQLLEMQAVGVLSRLDLAFSRDQKEKIYVQNKMHECSVELYQWLEKGAYFYVCGDATRMAKDVDQALRDIVATQANLSADQATDYVNNLKREKRYLRDVY